MRLVEGIGSKLLPVAPYLFQNLGVVTVGLALFQEFGLHGINDGLLLLAHSLTQGVTLSSGEVGQLT